jgi:hypothetical protein
MDDVFGAAGGIRLPTSRRSTLHLSQMTTPEIPATAAPDEQPVNENADPSAAPAGTGGSRLAAVRDWLNGRADTSLARLALLWFRRYFEASRNSGAAATTYVTLSVLPTALVIVAIFNLAKGDENAFADRLISHMNLGGSTASVVHDLFGTTANNVLAASVTIVVGFLLWGLSIGQQYQDLYARAWRIHAGTAADQVRFTPLHLVQTGSDLGGVERTAQVALLYGAPFGRANHKVGGPCVRRAQPPRNE